MTQRLPPPLECLARLGPTPDEADLLRACLWEGPRGEAAWQKWLGAVDDPLTAIRRDVSGLKALLPLLHYGLRRSSAEVSAELRHLLGAARSREALRWQAYAAVVRRACAALADAGVRALVLKGAALAAVYPEPALRHSHDVDILVRETDAERAAVALHRAGFAAAPTVHRSSHTIRVLSEEQVPVELHTQLYRLAYYGAASRGIWERAIPSTIADTGARTLAPADHLVYVCAHASCAGSRDALTWIADAYFLAHHPDLEWSVVSTTANEQRVALPVAVLLELLAETFDAPVPSAVRDALADSAVASDRAARQIAITGLRSGRRGRLRDLFATSDWRSRLILAWWLLAPSPAALRGGEPLRHPRAWPAYYLLRPAAFTARRLRR